MTSSFSELEKQLNISFKKKNLLEQAFTHRSYINEHKQSEKGHNERLEFLGDAVLELVVTDHLFEMFPDKPEGELTAFRSALVNSDMLAAVAGGLDFEKHLLLSKGESKDNKGRARTYILANTIEAFIGALHLDQGYEAAKTFITAHIVPQLDKVIEDKSFIDAKSLFQEKAQDIVGITPSYKTVKETGPDHDKHFTVAVHIGKDHIVTGEGKSKQDAEQDAASKAIVEKGW